MIVLRSVDNYFAVVFKLVVSVQVDFLFARNKLDVGERAVDHAGTRSLAYTERIARNLKPCKGRGADVPTLIARIVAYVHVYLVALTDEYHSDGAFGRIAQDLPQRFGQLLHKFHLLPRTAVTAETAFCYVAVHFHAE